MITYQTGIRSYLGVEVQGRAKSVVNSGSERGKVTCKGRNSLEIREKLLYVILCFEKILLLFVNR